MIDNIPVPLVNNMNNSQAVAMPQSWIENKHRARTTP